MPKVTNAGKDHCQVMFIRRRDNLFAAIHMIVEALFWFHPLVWWIGARLVDERERACDEEVVRLGADPHQYAEGILRTCEYAVESPLACVAGVGRDREVGMRAGRAVAGQPQHPRAERGDDALVVRRRFGSRVGLRWQELCGIRTLEHPVDHRGIRNRSAVGIHHATR